MALIRRGGDEPTLAREVDPYQMVRDILRWDPFAEMLRPAIVRAARAMGFAPEFDIKETNDAFVFKADLPGVKESDLDISLTGNRLTVSGKREAEETKEGENYFAYERGFGTFTRVFTLPQGADTEKVRAELKDGVLSLIIPKRPEQQPKRVQLQSGAEKKPAKA